MAIWEFYEYVSTAGHGVITEWYETLSIKARAKFKARLAHLENLPRLEWRRPPFDLLTEQEGMGEIRFKADNKEHRVFGCFGPQAMQFTMLIGCIEKGNGKAAYKPTGAMETARRRSHEILKPQRIQPYAWKRPLSGTLR